jgi:hypothetical protein
VAVSRRHWLSVVLVGAVCLSGSHEAAQERPGPRRSGPPPFAADAGDLAVPVLPVRRPAPSAPPVPPELPPGADRVTPLTVHLTITTRARGRARAIAQTVTRTADRVHVAAASGAEWLFERNPVDPRRASGFFIEHTARTIVAYSDSDLRAMLGIPGWAHILTMGVDARTLATLSASAETRAVGGLRFVRMSGGPAHAPTLWWNADQLLPAEFVTREGGSLRVERLTAVADLGLVRPPDLRFPTYRMIELADWLEQH